MLILLSSTIKTFLSVMLPVPLPSIIMYPQSFIIPNFELFFSKKNHFRLHTLVAAYCPLVPTIDLKSQDLTQSLELSIG
jgi:hypothetical protein